MNNFEYWLEEVADMPHQKDDGSWVDLETGLPFDSNAHYKTGGKLTRWEPRDDVKEHRKIAKFYGGKALTGSVKQKVWAESIRAKILTSEDLSDEQKSEFIALGNMINTAKFWIDNKEALPSNFTKSVILKEDGILSSLYEKHYDTLVRSGPVGPKEAARIEIYTALESLKLKVVFDFPNCNFFDAFGQLEPHRFHNGRLVKSK